MAAPPVEPGWEEQQEASFRSTSGRVGLVSVSAGTPHVLTLPRPGTVQLRAYCSGRAATNSMYNADRLSFGQPVPPERWQVDILLTPEVDG